MKIDELRKLARASVKEILEADLPDEYLLSLCDHRPDLVDALDPQDVADMRDAKREAVKRGMIDLGFSERQAEELAEGA